MNVALTSIDPVVRVEDICRLLKISRTQFYDLRSSFFAKHGLLVEVLPRIDRHPRYSGAPFVKLLEDSTQQRLLRADLKALEKVS